MSTTPHDALFKTVFASPARAAELLRCLLPPELARQIDWASLELTHASHVDDDLLELHADLLFKAWVRGARIDILFEHKSFLDGWVALALYRYMGGAWDRHREREKSAPLLPPILPVVVYHSRHTWTAATEFSRLVDIPPGAELLRTYTPKFQFILFDLASADHAAMADLGVSEITQLTIRALHEVRDAPDVACMWNGWSDLLRAAPRDRDWDAFVRALFSYLRAVRKVEELRAIDFGLHNEGEVTMTFGEYLDRSKQEGKQEGKQETLLNLLRRKFSAVPSPLVARVETADLDTLDRWLDRILTASSLDEVFAGSPG